MEVRKDNGVELLVCVWMGGWRTMSRRNELEMKVGYELRVDQKDKVKPIGKGQLRARKLRRGIAHR